MRGSERDIYRVALELIRDKRHEDGSLITGREAEAIAFVALSDGAGLADPSDLSRAPVAGVSPSVSYPVTLQRALSTVKRLSEEAADGPWEMRDGEGEGVWSLGLRRLKRGDYGRDADMRLAAAASDLAASVVEMASALMEIREEFRSPNSESGYDGDPVELMAAAALASFATRFGAEP